MPVPSPYQIVLSGEEEAVLAARAEVIRRLLPPYRATRTGSLRGHVGTVRADRPES